MKIKVSGIRRIIKEEMTRIGKEEVILEFNPFSFRHSKKRREPAFRSRRSSSTDGTDATDVPDHGNAPLAHLNNPKSDIANAATMVLSALNYFNPKWHSMMCRTTSGEEMSDLVIELENNVKKLAKQMTESLDIKGVLTTEIFGGATSSKSSSRSRRSRGGRTRNTPEMVQSTDSPLVTQVKKNISDWLYLHNAFNPKFRRKMCLGQSGDKLAFALQNLDDMLAKG